jgi:hypothetical protein
MVVYVSDPIELHIVLIAALAIGVDVADASRPGDRTVETARFDARNGLDEIQIVAAVQGEVHGLGTGEDTRTHRSFCLELYY